MFVNRTSRWSIGAALICIVLVVACWFLLVSPRRADASTIRGQATQAESQSADLQVQVAQLKTEFADLPKQQLKLDKIRQELPPLASIPTFVRNMQSIALQSGVSLDSITPGTPVVVTSAKAGSAAAPGAAGAGALISVPMTIMTSGQYFETSLFIQDLQTKIARTFLVNGLALTPAAAAGSTAPSTTGTSSGTPTAGSSTTATPTTTAAPVINLDNVDMTLTGSVFVLLDGTVTLDQVKQAAATSGTTATPTPVATGVSTAAAN